MNEYQLNVRKVAEEMAKLNHISIFEDLTPAAKEDSISFYNEPARIAVRLQAESYAAGYVSAYSGDVPGGMAMWESNCREEMIELGLIDPIKCQSCDTALTTDDTGTYCNNNKCDQFWITK